MKAPLKMAQKARTTRADPGQTGGANGVRTNRFARRSVFYTPVSGYNVQPSQESENPVVIVGSLTARSE